jgi:beta-galactosidase
VSALTEFVHSEKGFNTLAGILKNAGILCTKREADMNDAFFLRDGRIHFPASTRDKFVPDDKGHTLDIRIFSPRPLDDLLIEPNLPKLALYADCRESALYINDEEFKAAHRTNRNSTYNELPLRQGWNKLTLKIGKGDKGSFTASFGCDNNSEFLPNVKISFVTSGD